MSENDTEMEILEETPNIEPEEIDQEMEKSDTTESLGPKDSEDTKEPDTSSVVLSKETLVGDSETIDELITETISDTPNEETPENKSKQSTRLPLARIKQIMKFDSDCSLISRDSLLLVSKATEMFIEFLGKESVKHTLNNKKKTVSRKDVEAAIDCAPNLYFLDGALDWD